MKNPSPRFVDARNTSDDISSKLIQISESKQSNAGQCLMQSTVGHSLIT